jgi:hypothetical protein
VSKTAALLTSYVSALSARLAGVTNEGAEAQLADLVPNLLVGLARDQGRPGIDLRGQAHEKAVGIPDFSIKDGLLLIGHVETKAPGSGADPARFKGKHDKDQWQRFKKLPNVLYTDGVEWALYRSGRRDGPLLKLDIASSGQSVSAVGPVAAAKLAALVAQAYSWKAVAPTSLTGLAVTLAPLTAVLRDEIRAQLEDEGSQVFKASEEFRAALFPERSLDQVADAFAQVCTYSMLLARSNGAGDLSANNVESTLRAGHPVLARVVRVLLDEETEKEIGWALDTVRTVIEAVDFEKLRGGRHLPGMTHYDQTWLYFYEAFLAAYDPKLRDAYGVYYTPQGVIAAQVTLLDELLRERFEKKQGLASPGVTVMDPAVGTGSYPLRIVETAAAIAKAKLGPGAVAGTLTGLAANLHAFEILVGPYSVAHLRLAELLTDYDATLPAGGAQVYLTDTLSSPYAEPTTLTRLLEPLVEEQKRALAVKDKARILVCIGNPPYERRSATGEDGEQHGGWVLHGDEGIEAAPLFHTFLDPANEQTIFSHVASLYNEYVYFWRWALWKVFESPNVNGAASQNPGVVSFISAASYLSGPGFVGMREHMRRLCDEVWIIDLGGEGRGTRKEENVFAIQTPVAIAMAVRYAEPDETTPAAVRYVRLAGTREEKLRRLGSITTFQDLDWLEGRSGWSEPFRPAGGEEWESWPRVIDLFPWQIPGLKAGRTWPIAPLRSLLEERWKVLAAAKTPAERDRAFVNPPHGRTTETVVGADTLPKPVSSATIANLKPSDPAPDVVRYSFRSFDRQWIIADPRVLSLQRPPLWFANSDDQTYMVGFFTGIVGEGPAVTAADCIPDLHFFRGSFGGKDVIPLYRSAQKTPNVTAGLVEKLKELVGLENLKPEDLFAYAYALLSAPSYVMRFWEELEQPGPRLPITLDPALFLEVRDVGKRALHLHTLGQRFRDETYAGATDTGRAKLIREFSDREVPDEVRYNAASETLYIGSAAIAPVSEAIWQFAVSGLLLSGVGLRGGCGTCRAGLDRPTARSTNFARRRGRTSTPSSCLSCFGRLSGRSTYTTSRRLSSNASAMRKLSDVSTCRCRPRPSARIPSSRHGGARPRGSTTISSQSTSTRSSRLPLRPACRAVSGDLRPPFTPVDSTKPDLQRPRRLTIRRAHQRSRA